MMEFVVLLFAACALGSWAEQRGRREGSRIAYYVGHVRGRARAFREIWHKLRRR